MVSVSSALGIAANEGLGLSLGALRLSWSAVMGTWTVLRSGSVYSVFSVWSCYQVADKLTQTVNTVIQEAGLGS